MIKHYLRKIKYPDSPRIKVGKFSIIFTQGIFHLFDGDEQLTKGLGLHIAWRKDGNWTTSYQKKIVIKKWGLEKISLELEIENNTFNWNIELKTKQLKWCLEQTSDNTDNTILETLKVVCMLPPSFQYWFKGFVENHLPRNQYWLEIAEDEGQGLGLRQLKHNEITIFASTKSQNKLSLENGDDKTQVRIFAWSQNKSLQTISGEVEIFSSSDYLKWQNKLREKLIQVDELDD